MITLLTGFSRIVDNKHHSSDVLSGWIIGLVVAIAIVSQIGRDMHAFALVCTIITSWSIIEAVDGVLCALCMLIVVFFMFYASRHVSIWTCIQH